MNWLSIVALIFSAVGILISIWAIIAAKKSNKEVLHQNLETELAGIEGKLGEIDAQIVKARTEGEEKNSFAYGILPNPNQEQIDALETQKRPLLKRKAEIEQKLKAL